MIIKRIPPEEQAGFHVKVYAAEALRGKRQEWGASRRWHGDYLRLVSVTWTGQSGRLPHPAEFTMGQWETTSPWKQGSHRAKCAAT